MLDRNGGLEGICYITTRYVSKELTPVQSNHHRRFLETLCSRTLAVINISTSTYTLPPYLLTGISNSTIARTPSTGFVVIASTPTSPTATYGVDLTVPYSMTMLRPSGFLSIPSERYSHAKHISFPRVGLRRDTCCHAFFLPAKNPHHLGPPGSLPPLIISDHGNPTLHEGPSRLCGQYYPTRGFAVALLNYAGSSGYGRLYCVVLDGSWGVLDTTDAASCAIHDHSQGVSTHHVLVYVVAGLGVTPRCEQSARPVHSREVLSVCLESVILKRRG